MKSIEITLYEIPLYVEYDYDEGEPMVMYYSDMSGHPGEPPSVDILDIYVNETSIYDIFDQSLIELLEEKILSYEHS